ncbi:MAG: 3-dehydroquinate synthase [Methyloprofundus sp.]|nr:3-dehydroquinate synthase [Methyloprofundus sp.]
MSFDVKQEFTIRYDYPVIFSSNVFNPDNKTFRNTLERAGKQQHRVFVIIDSSVIEAHPALISQINSYFSQHKDIMLQAGDCLSISGGELAKQGFHFINEIYQYIADEKICRHSFIVVIGGGAVIDAVGYAAATAHRGVRLIRFPTTVLAQNDAGLGVKNAINLNNRKNFIGTFSPPWAVINDYEFLRTLAIRDKRAGMAEAIKIALVKDKTFFDFMYQHRKSLACFEEQYVQKLINQCANLHLNHIATSGDPFEQGSARPLDFGHWLAHKLEELSGNELNHGEAVAIGIAVDSHYSYQIKWLAENELNLILELLTSLGFNLNAPVLKKVITETALDEFRQHLGGGLTITLLRKIGLGKEVNCIDNELMTKSIYSIYQYHPPN